MRSMVSGLATANPTRSPASAYAFDAVGRRMPGLRLQARNVIPHGRGMGSSGAAVVSGLLAAKGLLEGDVDLTDDRLLKTLTESGLIPKTDDFSDGPLPRAGNVERSWPTLTVVVEIVEKVVF